MCMITCNLRHAMSMVIILLSLVGGFSQFQPLNVVLQSTSDEIPFLSEDYIRQNNDLFLIVNSVENRERKFGVSISITGGGIAIRTNVFGRYETIQPFASRTYNNFELAEYFDIKNFDFKGYSKEDYLQNGGLPSGTYDICIELFDVTNDRGIPLSNSTCLTKYVDLINAPEITSPLDLEIVKEDGFELRWKHESVNSNFLNYEMHFYEYDLNLTKSEHILYKRPKVIRQTIKGVLKENISPKDLDLISGVVYVLFVKVDDRSKSYYRQGYSEGKIVQIEGAQKVLCSGDVIFTEVESNSSFTVLQATVEGCTPASYFWEGNQVGSGMSPFAYIQNPDQGLSVRIECTDGCIYIGTYGDQNCLAGSPCQPEDPCLVNGQLSSDCETCIGSPQVITLNTLQNVDGSVTYQPDINCSNAIYQWSNGSTDENLIIDDSDTNGYQVTVTCPGGCSYVGSVYPRDWVCITGGLCDDGDPCTLNDQYDENCGCVGEGDCTLNPPCSDAIDSYVGVNIDGSFALFANVDCDVAEIIWYPSLESTNAIVVDDLNGVSVVIKCADGCVYSKNFCEVGTSCNDGDPCTINDTYDFNCNCIGLQLPDADGDGVCDEEDQCPGIDDAECEDCMESVEYCNYEIIIRKNDCVIDEIEIFNPLTGEVFLLNESYNNLGFRFPYTLNDIGLSQYYNVKDLANHLNGWMNISGYSGDVKYKESGAEYVLEITNTYLQFGSMIIRCGNKKDKLKFEKKDCFSINDLMCDDDNPCTINDMYDEDCNCIGDPVGLSDDEELIITLDEDEQSLTATIGCDDATFVWSDGSTGSSIHYLPGIFYSVTATCGAEEDAVPCQFIATYGTEFTCTPGTTCDGPCEGMIYDLDCNCVPSLDFVDIAINEIEINGVTSYTLVPELDCNNTATFIWNTGETTRNITIEDLNGLYTVEITCGACTYMGIYQGSDSDCIDCDESCTGSVVIEAEINSEDLLILTAVSTCPADFYWNNGSNLPYIIVPADLNTYSVLAFCQDSDCTYQATYEGVTTFCSPGQPCDDNDPCTTDDTYMIDCSCVGTPIEAEVMVDISPILEETCNYLWTNFGNDLDGYSYIEKIQVRLPDNTILTLDPSFNDDGFDFPYCNANENGEFCDDASSLAVLVDHLNSWIQDNQSFTGAITFNNSNVPAPIGEPFNRSTIEIRNSNIEFLFTESYTSVQSGIIREFGNQGCDDEGAILGYEYTASINTECEVISYLWSNGATTSSVTLALADACIDLEVVCDGCVYTYSVDQDCDCVVGTPCIPSIGCEGITNEFCECITTSSSDVDGDGICDDEDECPGQNDHLYPDGCDEIDCSLLEIQSRTEEVTSENIITSIIHQAETLNCPNATYLWSNGSTSSSIEIPSMQQQYEVTITCGDCVEVLSFGEECTLGYLGAECTLEGNCYTSDIGYVDVNCNCVGQLIDGYETDTDGDGIYDCMELCDEGVSSAFDENGVEFCCDSPPTLEYAEEFFEVRDYCMVLPSSANTLEDIVIKVGNEDVHLNTVEGFNFPYCIATGCVELGGGPIEDFIAPTELDLLTDFVRDLIKWGANEGKYFQAIIYDEDEAEQSSCGTTELHIEIKGFPYAMTRITTDLGMIGMPVLPGYQGDPYYTINLVPHEDCEIESIEWSDGRSWTLGDSDPMPLTRGPLYSESIGYRVSITCSNGCVYEIESPDANCFVGDPCIPSLPCANNGVQVPGPYGCICIEDVNNVTSVIDENGDVILYENNDSDGDGVCDENDVCEGFDDNVDFDGNGIPDGCDDCRMNCISQISALPEKPENYIPDYYLLDELVISYPLDEETSQTLSLTNLTEFNFPYTLCDNGCEDFDPSSFVNDFNNWAANQNLNLSIGTIEFTETDVEYVLHFINSDVVIVDIWHELRGSIDGSSFFLGRGSINPPQDCYPSTCCYNAFKRVADCSMLIDIMVLHDGQERSLFDMLGLGNYSINKLFDFSSSCTQNSSSFNGIVQDLESADIEVSMERAGQDLEFILCSERFDIISFVWNQDVETETNGNPEIIIDFEEECVVGCDDGDPCTTDDHFETLPDGTCHCTGTYTDTDSDGICDELDECDEYPDQYDIDGDGVADVCDDPWIVCNSDEKNYAEYFIDRLECAHVHEGELPIERKLLVNNLVEWQNDFVRRFGDYDDNGTSNPYDDSWTPPTASAGFPFTELIEELVIFVGNPNPVNVDFDNDGMVDFLDPVFDIHARTLEGHILDDIHEKSQMITAFNNAQDIISSYYNNTGATEEEAFKQIRRFSLWNQILFSAYTTVSLDLPIFTNQNILGSSPCLAGIDGIPLVIQPEDEIEINGSGWIKDPVGGCWMEVEVDCDCNCNIIYHPDIDGNGDCNEIEIIGTTCTDDPEEADPAIGLEYIQCPPDNPNECFVYGLVSNPDYYPYDEDGNYIIGYDVPSCNCVPLNADEDGNYYDSDEDGVCDLLDACEGPDTDEDPVEGTDELGDGVPDCIDKCPLFDNGLLAQYAIDPDFPPTGPGDACDDGNPCTYNDVITEECGCSGVYVDTDHDGVYDCEECDVESIIAELTNPDGTVNVYTPTEVYVDEKGRPVDSSEPGAILWLGCDLCPGLDDRTYTGPAEDENGDQVGDDVYDDYDNDGLPDCIDPPWKEICPDDFEITEDGLVLIFNTEDLDASDYPEPITFQGVTNNNGLIHIEYLTVAFARELEDGTTEVFYELDLGNNTAGDFSIANIIYSDHQVCDLIDSEVVSLPCPEQIVDNQLIFNHQYVDFDISDLIGDFLINGESYGADLTNYNVYATQMELNVPSDFGLNANFSGTIELPNGLLCEYNQGEMDECQAVLINGQTVDVVPGDPCDDGDDCTHHDKFITTTEGNCECHGELRPDTDEDGLCDEIDPCPEDFNADVDGDGVGDLDQCPCDELELDVTIPDNPELINNTDFEVHFSNDLSLYNNIEVEIWNFQDDPLIISVPTSSPIVIPNLTQGLTFSIIIRGICVQVEDDLNTEEDETVESESVYSTEVDVPFTDDPSTCEIEFEEVSVSNLNSLPSLSKGSEFQASDFTVTVRNVTGQAGVFSGTGYIRAAHFNFIRLNVRFDNITISSASQMTDGVIHVKGIGLAILGDDISNAINDQLDGILNTLEDLEDILDDIIETIELMDDFYYSIKDLVTEENKECFNSAMQILNQMVADAQAGDPDITLEMIQNQMQAVKDCLDEAEDDAIVNTANVKELLKYSFSEIHFECTEEELSIDYLNDMSFTQDNTTELISNMFDSFDAGSSSGLSPSLGALDVVTYQDFSSFDNDSYLAGVADIDMILEHYERECLFLLCNVSQIYDDQNVLDQSGSTEILESILNSMIAVDADLVNQFSEELTNNVPVEEIYQIEANKVFIKKAIARAVAYNLYSK